MIIEINNKPCIILNDRKDLGPEFHYEILHNNQKSIIAIQKSGIVCERVTTKEKNIPKHWWPMPNEVEITYYMFNTSNLHREHGWAFQSISDNGEHYQYWQLGELHRLDGPAVFWTDRMHLGTYYINGKEFVTEEEYEFAVKEYKNDNKL